jgi:hypothetical protein
MREGVQVKGFEAAKGGRFGAAEARHARNNKSEFA